MLKGALTMPIEYFEAPDVKELVDNIAESLGLFHVVPQFVYCVRSKGSKSRRILARIHGLGRIWQEALRRPPSYIIEVISERYDNLSQVDKEKTLIHELLHIPKGFTGGFRPHKGYVDQKTVEAFYKRLQEHRKTRNANNT
jgi:predicted metallopeptidase